MFIMCLTAKECGGVLTEPQKTIQSPGFPEEYQDEQICYWHIRVRLGQRIHLRFLEFDVEDDTACLADYLEVYDSYDDVSGFAGRWGLLNVALFYMQQPTAQKHKFVNLWMNWFKFGLFLCLSKHRPDKQSVSVCQKKKVKPLSDCKKTCM